MHRLASRRPVASLLSSAARVRLSALIALISGLTTWWVWGALEPRPCGSGRVFLRPSGEHLLARPLDGATSASGELISTDACTDVAARRLQVPSGHALVLAVGALVRMPWLPVLLLSGLSGALIFILLEPLVGKWIAVLGWVTWLSDPINLRFRPGYYSEVTSGVAWLLAWWCLREWRASDD